LKKIIQVNFDQVGKGWFNIFETSKETYEFGKLKKFLVLVNFMMQDTILTMCRSSVISFMHYILKFCPESTEITTTNSVKNIFNKKMVTEEDSDFEAEPFTEIDAKEHNEY
jgi:dynein heavy chain, axonemal